MKITVNWALLKNQLGLEILTIEPVPVLKHYSDNKGALFRECPAYIDSLKNTFVMLSPIDLRVVINAEEMWANVENPKDLPRDRFVLRFDQSKESPYPLFSLLLPQAIFYSEHNVVLEMLDPFLEWERKNPVRIVPGKFNIKKWIRPTEFAFEAKQKIFILDIKRGDPLCYLRFYTDSPSDIVALNMVAMTDELEREYLENSSVKSFYKSASLEFLYNLRSKYKQLINKE